jgi:FKBP-type peptidyl-prolyl cis-trans isomerase
MLRKKNLMSLLITTAVIVLSFSSCIKSPDPTDYKKQEQDEITKYLTDNPTLAFQEKESGLYYLETRAGSGPVAIASDTVYLKYTVKFLDGYLLETNVGKTDTLKFPLSTQGIIPGLTEGVSYMSQGTKALLLIPSDLAYGPYGRYPVSGYTPLLFDIELVRLKHGAVK